MTYERYISAMKQQHVSMGMQVARVGGLKLSQLAHGWLCATLFRCHHLLSDAEAVTMLIPAVSRIETL